MANFVPHIRAVHVRLPKAALMLIAAVQCHSTPEELESFAGIQPDEVPDHAGRSPDVQGFQTKYPNAVDQQ
jgi:hypothetical protein